MTMMTESKDKPARKRRIPKIARVASLDALLGAHPDGLRDIFAAGSPTDPAAYQGSPRGLLLAVEPWNEAFMAVRPLIRAVSGIMPWKGIVFETGGTSGHNRVLGRNMFRFSCEVTESHLDGEPALLMRYQDLGNPWPVADTMSELREAGDGVAVGPAYKITDYGPRVLFWWGLTSR